MKSMKRSQGVAFDVLPGSAWGPAVRNKHVSDLCLPAWEDTSNLANPHLYLSGAHSISSWWLSSAETPKQSSHLLFELIDTPRWQKPDRITLGWDHSGRLSHTVTFLPGSWEIFSRQALLAQVKFFSSWRLFSMQKKMPRNYAPNEVWVPTSSSFRLRHCSHQL